MRAANYVSAAYFTNAGSIPSWSMAKAQNHFTPPQKKHNPT
jgi:hypothetical protein